MRRHRSTEYELKKGGTGLPAVTTGKQVADELAKTHFEPFLPVAAKLVTWSLALGVGLLAVLVWVSNTFFAR